MQKYFSFKPLAMFEPKLCKNNCGHHVPQRYNSTIQDDECPYCKLKAAMKKPKVKNSTFATGKKKAGKLDFYKTKAWKYCSHYVLTYYANNEGIVQCSTSGKWMHVTDKNTHCGHFLKLNDAGNTNYSVCLEFENLAPQSYRENVFKGGNQLEMRKWLVKQHGEGVIEQLEMKSKNACKLDQFTLDYYANYYKEKLDALLKERGIKDFWKSK